MMKNNIKTIMQIFAKHYNCTVLIITIIIFTVKLMCYYIDCSVFALIFSVSRLQHF